MTTNAELQKRIQLRLDMMRKLRAMFTTTEKKDA